MEIGVIVTVMLLIVSHSLGTMVLMCIRTTTGHLLPTLAIRPAHGTSTWATASCTPTASPTTSMYGRFVPDIDCSVIWLFGSFSFLGAGL
ncbi:hypothetical protein MBAV_005153 [Candidatus Magnetobacterium bavaricum]|uniref:Uncharacterized protein n=1 Tax=Candidatus Magnetobacterium bavaricum TaxID=29290 RepID=A0A0F3GL60_9BACT|nr:hypothetical protein MBAV_005153 [Candidatus Magnetobacterium bavaricum]